MEGGRAYHKVSTNQSGSDRNQQVKNYQAKPLLHAKIERQREDKYAEVDSVLYMLCKGAKLNKEQWGRKDGISKRNKGDHEHVFLICLLFVFLQFPCVGKIPAGMIRIQLIRRRQGFSSCTVITLSFQS